MTLVMSKWPQHGEKLARFCGCFQKSVLSMWIVCVAGLKVHLLGPFSLGMLYGNDKLLKPSMLLHVSVSLPYEIREVGN